MRYTGDEHAPYGDGLIAYFLSRKDEVATVDSRESYPLEPMNQTTLNHWDAEDPQTRTDVSARYTIKEEAMGFRIEGRDRHPVFVRLAPNLTHFLIAGTVEEITTLDGHARLCNLYGYYRLLDSIASIAMQNWQRPSNPPGAWGDVGTWALGRTRRALHFRGVYQQWQRLLACVPEPQRAVTRAVFAATFETSRLGCETWSELYHLPYLVEDILRYRAAASAVHYAEHLAIRVSSILEQRRAMASLPAYTGPLTERFETFGQRRRTSITMFACTDDWEQTERLRQHVNAQERRDVLDILAHDWKALYSGSGVAGKSVRRILMNLPGGISGKLLTELPKLDLFLTKPITDRVELMTFLTWSGYAAPFSHTLITPEHWEGSIYRKAQRAEILSALHLLSADRKRVLPDEPALTPYRRGIGLLMGYLDDYCRACRQEHIPAHQGTIVGLTEKALQWHREVQAREMQLRQTLLDGTALAALPPILLPKNPIIRFLSTAGEIQQEGASMHHCIASLALRAVQGQCYLFHITYQGTEASIQVNQAGNVVQSYGPYNSTNAAAKYGASLLEKWGQHFPQHTAVGNQT